MRQKEWTERMREGKLLDEHVERGREGLWETRESLGKQRWKVKWKLETVNVTENTHANHLSKSWLWYVLYTFLWFMTIFFRCFVVSTAESHARQQILTCRSVTGTHTRLKKSSDMRPRDNNVKSNDISTISILSIHSLVILTFVVSFSFTFRFLLSLVGMIELSFLLSLTHTA